MMRVLRRKYFKYLHQTNTSVFAISAIKEPYSFSPVPLSEELVQLGTLFILQLMLTSGSVYHLNNK